MRPLRSIFPAVLMLALAGLVPNLAFGHPEGVSDMPELASGPSDPVLVHRSLEVPELSWYAGMERAQSGCPDYSPKFGEDGSIESLEPVLNYCATDRISMFEHSTTQCTGSYAARCMEQVMPRRNLPRGGAFSMYGVLYDRGQPEPSRKLVLERRVLGTASGFSPFSTQPTASVGEIGSVRIKDVARSKTAYRWGVLDDATKQLIYSTVPFVSHVEPTVRTAKLSKTRVRRTESFTAAITTDVPIWSTVRLEYRFENRWIQISRIAPQGRTSFSIQGRINRVSGSFPTRVVIGSVATTGRPWYDEATRTIGTMKVLSSWTVVR